MASVVKSYIDCLSLCPALPVYKTLLWIYCRILFFFFKENFGLNEIGGNLCFLLVAEKSFVL